jgi:hypothetical protein
MFVAPFRIKQANINMVVVAVVAAVGVLAVVAAVVVVVAATISSISNNTKHCIPIHCRRCDTFW